ncbi:5'-nucleotidase [Xylariaceae sp. FL0594]|nr:5'-nucleotidase [Xylariaceae sp. FL0594]
MREPNDNKLAEQTDGLIDIILGGHDHYYNHSIIKGTHVLRSGSDFKQLSYIEARRKGDGSGRWDFDITRRDITSEIAEDKPTVELVGKLTATLKTTIQRPIGYSAAPLDARFRTVRLEESNLGNFVCDIMRFYYSGDCSLMASGTIRGDQVYPPGPILLKDILSCFPFEDPVVVIKVTGQAIWDALENSVSLYPALEGRFPQVSNIKFEFDDRKPSGSRILSAGIGGEPIDMERKYVLVTRGYMARGKDGYTSLLVEAEGGKAEEIVSEENGILIQMMLRQYFMSLKVVGHWKYWSEGMSAHWSSVTDKVSAKHPLLNCTCAKSKTEPEPETSSSAPPQQQKEQEQQSHKTGWDQWTPESIRQRRCAALHDDEDDETSTKDEEEEAKARAIEEMDREMKLMRRAFRRWARRARVVCKVVDELQADDVECDWTRPIAPRVEGRIIRVGAD